MTVARVRLWGTAIGAVNLEPGRAGVFQYDQQFRGSGIEVSPIVMPLSDNQYTFPALNRESFHRLPGLLADSLPDKYGNALINAWLAGQGRDAEASTPSSASVMSVGAASARWSSSLPTARVRLATRTCRSQRSSNSRPRS